MKIAASNEEKAKTQLFVVEKLVRLASIVLVKANEWLNSVLGRLKNAKDAF